MTTKPECKVGAMFNIDLAKAKEITFTIHVDKPTTPWKEVPLENSKDMDFAPNIKRVHASYTAPYTGDMDGSAMHDFIKTTAGEVDTARGDWALFDDVTLTGDVCSGLCIRSWRVWLKADATAGHAMFSGNILGREGSVAIAQAGNYRGGKYTAYWSFIEGTGSGELVGMSGAGMFEGPAREGEPRFGKLKVQFD